MVLLFTCVLRPHLCTSEDSSDTLLSVDFSLVTVKNRSRRRLLLTGVVTSVVVVGVVVVVVTLVGIGGGVGTVTAGVGTATTAADACNCCFHTFFGLNCELLAASSFTAS